MFQVFDNHHPADESGFPHLKGYASKFETFDEAPVYTGRWLGPQWVDGLEGIVLELNIPHDYDGFEDMILIKEIDE